MRAICRPFALLTVTAFVFTSPAMAMTFTDGTFNQSDYSVTRFTQTGAVSVQQIATGGDPGSALAVDISVPATPPFTTDVSEIYFLNRNFEYTPSGSAITLSFSIEKEISSASPPGIGVANGQGFILSQNGNLYQTGVSLSSTLGTFLTASTGSLSADDFDLITNLAADATDPNTHPDFLTGPITFGFKGGLGVPPNTANAQLDAVYDNFEVEASPVVPLPGSAWLMLSGLCGLGVLVRTNDFNARQSFAPASECCAVDEPASVPRLLRQVKMPPRSKPQTEGRGFQ